MYKLCVLFNKDPCINIYIFNTQGGAGTLVYKKATSVTMSYHLYLSVEEIDHAFPDDMELFFRLYDIERKEYIR